MLLAGLHCAALSMVLSSCSSNIPVQRDVQHSDKDVPASPYSIVFVIHGDGDYLYHDTSGNEYSADEEALARAKSVALQNPSAEVFIFHQRPRRHFLFLFPLHDGEFYYYRNGQLAANESYWRESEQSHFDPEVRLYRHFRAGNQSMMTNLLIYCGHEVPEFGGEGYDASFPDRAFTVHDLATGVRGLTSDSARVDLMVLSTCFGGTPYTIGTLGSVARYIVASPENLHLSYFDFSSFERLDTTMRDGDVPVFARGFARQAFDRLTDNVQTAVSVAVYDVDRIQEFLHSVEMIYDSSMTMLKEATRSSGDMIEWCDCADLSASMLPTIQSGVSVFYRPARFGRSTHKQSHSGWACRREGLLHAIPETSDAVSK